MSKGEMAAGVVAFRPDPDIFLPLVQRLVGEIDAVFVFVNGAIDASTLEAVQAAGARVIESPYNLGVGEAFNQLALHAIWAGYARLAIFDDDSGLPPGALEALGRSMNALEAAGERPAVIGPRIVSPPESSEAYRPPRYFRAARERIGDAYGVWYVISSGSLIDLDAYRRVGAFRSDFFMDAIDTEWCFRARARGFSCWVDESVRMEHRIGAGVTRATIFGRGFPKQPPMRLYAYIRNQSYCLGLPHLPLWWRVLLAAHLMRLCAAYWLAADDRLDAARLIREAARDGVAHRLGPPPQSECVARLHAYAHADGRAGTSSRRSFRR
jgi:rhamnosyltransferase